MLPCSPFSTDVPPLMAHLSHRSDTQPRDPRDEHLGVQSASDFRVVRRFEKQLQRFDEMGSRGLDGVALARDCIPTALSQASPGGAERWQAVSGMLDWRVWGNR